MLSRNRKEESGLRVHEFLNMVGSNDDRSYQNIDHLWVAPKEYGKIIRTLETDRVVIITGPPEYGKTYSSVRILWEYYHKGYIPKLLEFEDAAIGETRLNRVVDEILKVAEQKKIL